MTDLHASAEEFNIRASVSKYLVTNLGGATGPATDIEAARWAWFDDKYDEATANYFVRVTLQETEGRFFHNVSGANGGSLKSWVLMLQLFMKRTWLGTDQAKFANTMTLLRSAFKNNDAIAVADWRGDPTGATAVDSLVVRGRQRFDPKPAEAWVSGGWMLDLEWIEQDAAA